MSDYLYSFSDSESVIGSVPAQTGQVEGKEGELCYFGKELEHYVFKHQEEPKGKWRGSAFLLIAAHDLWCLITTINYFLSHI